MNRDQTPNEKSERKFLMIFFILAFGISWISFGLEIIAEFQGYDTNLIFVIQRITKFGPTIAGLIVAAIYSKSYLRQLIKNQFRIRESWKWYVISLILPAVVMLIAIGLLMLGGGTTILSINWLWPSTIIQLLYWLGLRIFLGGGFGEEMGFRGFAWPRLESKYGYRKAGWILGVVWGLWHLPAIVLSSNPLISFIFQMVYTISVNFIFIHIYSKTKGNIWILSLLHGALNGWSAFFEQDLFPTLIDEDLWLILYVVLLIGIALIWKPKKGKKKE